MKNSQSIQTKTNSLRYFPFKLFLLILGVVILYACEDVLEKDVSVAPFILIQPIDVSVMPGDTATFLVKANGTMPLTYQWYKNGEEITGATDSSYTTPIVAMEDDSSNFFVIVSNKQDFIVSQPALLTLNKNTQTIPDVISFTTEGSSFAPVIELEVNATVLWSWSDNTTSNSTVPNKNFGSEAKRVQKLQVTPWSALKSINIGYDAGDGGSGSITHVANQNVSLVEGLRIVAPTLEIWCSSYNQIKSLDFTNFVKLHTIECYLSGTLENVNLTNTPALKRACFEDCSLKTLDLSQSPLLEDLRGAVNNYTSINFGTIGEHVWHICVRDNPQITDKDIFMDMTQFPEISELFIWNDNQAGELRIPSSSSSRGVSLLCDGNHYTSLDLSGALQNSQSVAEVSFRYNNLSNITIENCVQICILNLENNNLSSTEGDEILAALDSLGRSRDITPESWSLSVNLSGNTVPGTDGNVHAQSLAAKGWTVITDEWTLEPGVPAETGEARIDFATNGDVTNMRCDFSGSPTVTWHWSDGSTSAGISGQTVSKSALGYGIHNHYFTISNGAALNRFGASDGGSNGHLVSISDFVNCPSLRFIYVYNEPSLTALGRTNTTKTREYHLMSTGLSQESMDQIFDDAVATNVLNGILYCNNLGTSASDTNRLKLVDRGWTLNH